MKVNLGTVVLVKNTDRFFITMSLPKIYLK